MKSCTVVHQLFPLRICCESRLAREDHHHYVCRLGYFSVPLVQRWRLRQKARVLPVQPVVHVIHALALSQARFGSLEHQLRFSIVHRCTISAGCARSLDLPFPV